MVTYQDCGYQRKAAKGVAQLVARLRRRFFWSQRRDGEALMPFRHSGEVEKLQLREMCQRAGGL